MPGHKRLAAALAAALAAVAISACGSSDADRTIDPADADRLQAALAQVEGAIDQGKCPQARKHAQAFVDIVNGLPETVGTENKEALRAAGENLEDLAADPDKCVQTGTTELTDEEPTTTDETTTTPPETTVPTATTTSTTTTSTPPPDNGGDDDTGGPPTDTPGGGPPPDTGGGGDTGGGTGGGTGGTGTGGTGTGGTG